MSVSAPFPAFASWVNAVLASFCSGFDCGIWLFVFIS